jgi:glutamate-1-semialdehyde 2,1-aminomutase
MNYSKSINEFSSAKELIPGGVNSPVRAFKSVNCSPVFIASAKGSQITDIDGNKYVDFVSSWGPMILGHANEAVLNAISTSAKNGTSYGAPTQVESLMAKKNN